MDQQIIEGIEIFPLAVIETEKGSVRHILKKSSIGFDDFGEAYFSEICQGAIKGWKKHKKMVMNLFIAEGEVNFVFFDDRQNSKTLGSFFSVTLSLEKYCRIRVPAGVWMAFQGVGNKTNRILNIASIEHDPNEVEQSPIDVFPYEWN